MDILRRDYLWWEKKGFLKKFLNAHRVSNKSLKGLDNIENI